MDRGMHPSSVTVKLYSNARNTIQRVTQSKYVFDIDALSKVLGPIPGCIQIILSADGAWVGRTGPNLGLYMVKREEDGLMFKAWEEGTILVLCALTVSGSTNHLIYSLRLPTKRLIAKTGNALPLEMRAHAYFFRNGRKTKYDPEYQSSRKDIIQPFFDVVKLGLNDLLHYTSEPRLDEISWIPNLPDT